MTAIISGTVVLCIGAIGGIFAWLMKRRYQKLDEDEDRAVRGEVYMGGGDGNAPRKYKMREVGARHFGIAVTWSAYDPGAALCHFNTVQTQQIMGLVDGVGAVKLPRELMQIVRDYIHLQCMTDDAQPVSIAMTHRHANRAYFYINSQHMDLQRQMGTCAARLTATATVVTCPACAIDHPEYTDMYTFDICPVCKLYICSRRMEGDRLSWRCIECKRKVCTFCARMHPGDIHVVKCKPCAALK
jgi:hypothetical protein